MIVPEGLFERGLPNSLPLPNSRQKPCQDFFGNAHVSLPFGKHIQVAHAWTGVEFAWLLTQDDGRLELTGNAFPIDPVSHLRHRIDWENIA